jgi:hypothetical protein
MISASVVADSISPDGVRLTTMLLRYPRFIHAEFMTHRMFSRNASSSRAIPVERMLEDVMTDPAKPVRWGVNGKGMQDHGELKTFTLWFLQDGPKDEEELIVLVTALACRVSAARCARVSYLNHDGTVPDPTKDLELFKRLVEGERMHASPLEHQATPDLRMPDGEWDNTPLQGNLVGWMQFRKFFPNESQVQHVR